MTSNNILGEEGLVCAGYSQVYKELCERADIPCDYIKGTGISPFDGGKIINVVITNKSNIIAIIYKIIFFFSIFVLRNRNLI